MWREEFGSIKATPAELRKFGLMMGAILLVISAFLLWKGRTSFSCFAAAGIALAVLGGLVPATLRYLHLAWMALALILGFVMTRVILSLVFFSLFTPVALVAKLLGKDLLAERWDPKTTSYWVKRQPGPFDPGTAERMF